MVTGGDGVEAERIGAPEERAELDRAIALDTRVGSATGRVLANVGLDHDVVERVGEVEHVVRDVELRRDPSRVLDVADAAAAGVGLAAPELERDTRDVVALLEQERSRDRRVDPTAHRDEHALAHARAHAAAPAWRSCSTARGITASATSTSWSVDA